MTNHNIYKLITKQLNLPETSVKHTIDLLEGGATIPFISRYRKEATGSLDEVAIGNIDTAWRALIELIKRKEIVIDTIKEQSKMQPSLLKKINECWDAVTLEDIYLPYKKKRKTRAIMAKEKGLEPLANEIWQQRNKEIYKKAKKFLYKEVKTVQDALAGARYIIAERINEENKARQTIRNLYQRTAILFSKVSPKKQAAAEKYSDYFKYEEPAKKIPAHRLLAVLR